jgi:hypothetical protein
MVATASGARIDELFAIDAKARRQNPEVGRARIPRCWAFVGTNPTVEPMIPSLPVSRRQSAPR